MRCMLRWMTCLLYTSRVQSVAVRLIVEREREVHAFVSEPSYRVTAVFEVPGMSGKRPEWSMCACVTNT